jgi:hypothetical protein
MTTRESKMLRASLAESGGESDRVTYIELFYDLVFAFAVTQILHVRIQASCLTQVGHGSSTASQPSQEPSACPTGRAAYGMANKIETTTTRGVSIYLAKPQFSVANKIETGQLPSGNQRPARTGNLRAVGLR